MPKCHFLATVVLLSLIATANSPDALRATQANPADAQSSDEFRAQVSAIVQSYRAGDATTGRKLIEQFRLPHPQAWFSEHLGPEESARLAKRYDRLYTNFAESFEHTVEAIVASRDAELLIQLDNGRGETPTRVRIPDKKPSGTVSINPAPLFYGHFQITVQRRENTSWADTFLHQDGAFRFMGFGAWPFWVWQDGSEGSAPMGGSLSTPPILISRVNPEYPPEARSKKIEGVVVLHLLIDKEGFVKKADILSGDPHLTLAALDSVRQWRFKPATLGGAACEGDATVNIPFSLQ